MRSYFIVLAALAVLTALMAAPDLATLALLFTLGLGFPLVYAATGLLYALCVAPLATLSSRGPAALAFGVALSALLAFFAATEPAREGRARAEAVAAELRKEDHLPQGSVARDTLEILMRASNPNGQPFVPEQCGGLCLALMKSGQLRWLRVVDAAHTPRNGQPLSTLYAAKHGKDCAVPGSPADEATVCVVQAPDSGEAAQLALEISPGPSPLNGGRLSAFAQIANSLQVTARLASGEEAMLQTEVGVMTPTTPTLLSPTFEGWNSSGVAVQLQPSKINAFSLTRALLQLGYKLDDAAAPPPAREPWRELLNAEMTRQVLAVLDLPGAAPFDQAQMGAVSNWILHAHNVDVWTPELIGVLRRIVKDRRVRSPTPIAPIFARRPEVAKALMPDVLDVLETEGVDRDYTPARQIAYTFPTIDPDLLKPYAQRYVGLLGRGGEVEAILLPAVGRIGVDPLPYLTPILRDRVGKPNSDSGPRAIGACRAEARWAPQLIEPLRAAYRDAQGNRGDDFAYRGLLLKVLVKLGDKDFVDRELGASDRIDSKRVGNLIAFGLTKPDPADWLCQGF